MHALLPLLALALLGGAPKAAPKTAPIVAAPSVVAFPKAEELVAGRTRALLRALTARDVKALLSLLDASQAVTFGADVAEACTDAACIEKQAKESFTLVDGAKYGEPKTLHLQASAALATAWFDVPAEVVLGKEKKTVTQRFATTWKLEGSEWKLVQWLRFAPTVERSARELLKENELK